MKKLRWVTLLSYSVIEMGGSWVVSGGAIASPSQNQFTLNRQDVPSTQSNIAQSDIAQSDGGCRQTNATTGVYEQPNLDSTSRGILSPAQTVRLEVLGTGTGWARINQPVVGWIQARYLTPNASCSSLGSNLGSTGAAASANPTTSRPSETTDRTSSQPRQQGASFPSPVPDLRSNRSTNGNVRSPSTQAPGTQAPDTQAPGSQAPSTQITTLTCDVLPTEELKVRREPIESVDTYITTIPVGTYQFQFTRTTRTLETPQGTQRWVYIMAPVEGWISLGYVGKDFNLGGQECG